ncbi:MAG TPA: tyrosine-type recombinase/integrase [Anaeromyxobacteraceae bacterium]|nr:tyrosine-type recombinase/integrase [Anaeromyxobacteraceae bacterium]
MADGTQEERTWEGGFWRLDTNGRRVYVIRRSVNGRRYVISTRARNEAAAVAQLRRFEADPEGFNPRGVVRADPIFLDDKLRLAFLEWSAKPKKEGGRGNTRIWVHEQKLYLEWWQKRLEGVDLRRASFQDHIRPPLKDATAQRQRGAVLLALYRWLRLECDLSLTEDPVHGRLVFGEPEPEQNRRSKVVPSDHIGLVIEHLTAPWRHVLAVQAGTAWHVTEVMRFAAGGTIEPLPKNVVQEGVAAVLVCPRHKSGDSIRSRVSADVVEAAKALREHGSFSRDWYFRAVKSACATVKRPDGEVGIPVFTPGMIRASVATHAVNGGTDPSAVASYLGHRSKKTTERFYLGGQVKTGQWWTGQNRPTARTRDRLASNLRRPPAASRRAWSASCAGRT